MTKPEIEFQAGPPPTDLVVEDITIGDGDEAVPGGKVEVHYVGVEFDTGEEFDSSWNRGESINFPLQSLIAGWQEGIPGMKVGGRRRLTVPPEMAYGPAGRGHRLSGKTLVFVIDLLGVG
ncbi:FKBP-type peptidyl-prolyl cis-trans isomerase [Actinomycetes bacterium M1A6_2h]